MVMRKSQINQEIWTKKLALAVRTSKFLVFVVPYIQGIALTGSVAYGDVDEDDDLDFFIITKPRRVYTTRLLTYLWALFLGRKRTGKHEKNTWCLNLFLDEADLRVPVSRQSEFARLQVSRMRVLFERTACFERFRACNADWLGLNIVNDYPPITGKPRWWSLLGDKLEVILRRWQLNYMRPKVTREYLSPTQIFFHPLDRSKKRP